MYSKGSVRTRARFIPNCRANGENNLIVGREGPLPAVRTGPDGRFCLTGVGRDRVSLLFIEGESIEQTLAMVFTTRDSTYKPFLLPADNLGAHPASTGHGWKTFGCPAT